VANDDSGIGVRCYGAVLERSYRYNQDVSVVTVLSGKSSCPEQPVRRSRIQKASRVEGETALSRFMTVAGDMFRQEGPRAFYKGIFPRVLRVAPGQAIVFTVSLGNLDH
jgi:hypothetical protein